MNKIEKNKIIKRITFLLDDNNLTLAYYFLPEDEKQEIDNNFMKFWVRKFPELAENVKKFKEPNIADLVQANKINPLFMHKYKSEIDKEMSGKQTFNYLLGLTLLKSSEQDSYLDNHSEPKKGPHF